MNRRITSVLLALLGAAVPGLFAQGAEKLTPESLLDVAKIGIPRPSGFAWLRDSQHVLLSMPEFEGGSSKSKAWIETMDVATGERTRVIPGSSPKLSPDASHVAFITGEGSSRTISIYDFKTRESKVLMPCPEGFEGATFGWAWSPDSRSIAYGFRPEIPEASSKETPGNSSVIVFGGEGDLPPDSEVWVINVSSGEKRKLTHGPYRFASPNWYPDSKGFVFTNVGSFEYRNDNMYGKVVEVSVDSGEVRTIVKDSGVQHLAPSVSPDGTMVAFRYDPNNVFYPYYDNIAVLPAHGGAIKQLSKKIFVASGPIWAPDSKSIYFNCKSGAYSEICSVNLAGELRHVVHGPYNIGGVTISPDGKRMLITTDDARGRVAVRIADSNGQGERILMDLTPKAITKYAIGEVDEISWPSKDGLVNHGLVFKPADYQAGKRYPLLVDLHGGPVGGVSLVGSILLKTPLEYHMWASRGFMVFAADYRTSEIAGWDAVLKSRKNQDYNARDMDDIMTGVDYLAAKGMVDTNKLALVGHSNGSYLTNWLITHTNRFKVAVSYEGVSDHYISYGAGLRVGGNAFSEWMFLGKPWDVPQNYEKTSASRFVKGVTTPTLFIANDYKGGSGVENLFHHEFMYTALKKQGVDTQLLEYRGEGHVIQRPENLRDLLTRVISWIDGHMPTAN